MSSRDENKGKIQGKDYGIQTRVKKNLEQRMEKSELISDFTSVKVLPLQFLLTCSP